MHRKDLDEHVQIKVSYGNVMHVWDDKTKASSIIKTHFSSKGMLIQAVAKIYTWQVCLDVYLGAFHSKSW